MDNTTAKKIYDAAEKLYKLILRKEVPALNFPIRSLDNVTYDKKKGFFEIGDRTLERTLSFNTVKTFAQTIRMMALSHEIVIAETRLVAKRGGHRDVGELTTTP